MWPSSGGHGKGNSIDEVPVWSQIQAPRLIHDACLASIKRCLPSPVALDLNRVRSCIQKHLSSRDGGPASGSWQGDLRARAPVQDDSRVLVAIRAIVDDLEIIDCLGGGCDRKLDLVGGRIKSFNVSGT